MKTKKTKLNSAPAQINIDCNIKGISTYIVNGWPTDITTIKLVGDNPIPSLSTNKLKIIFDDRHPFQLGMQNGELLLYMTKDFRRSIMETITISNGQKLKIVIDTTTEYKEATAVDISYGYYTPLKATKRS